MKRFTTLVTLIFGAVACLSVATLVSAASSSITIESSTSSVKVGDVFTIDVLLDSSGEAFNAAQATITLSSTLLAEKITLGDCNFAYVTTPSLSNPSFAGAILGDKSTHCRLYTLQLKAVASGTGTVSVRDASMKSYKDSRELFPTITDGSVSIARSAIPEMTVAPQSRSGKNLTAYQVQLSILDKKGNPVAGAQVQLLPEYSLKSTEATGVVSFSDVSQGAHQIIVKKDNRLISSTIITVSGETPVLVMNLQEQPEKGLGTSGIIIVCLVLIMIILSLVYVILKISKKKPVEPNTTI